LEHLLQLGWWRPKKRPTGLSLTRREAANHTSLKCEVIRYPPERCYNAANNKKSVGLAMATYDFRLRFNLSESYRIDSDAEELELLALRTGERIKLHSTVLGKPIKDCTAAVVLGGQYGSEDQAREAAERSKRALLYWAIEQRVGIDFGDGKQRSVATNVYLAMLEKEHGHPFRNDIHGIDVYEHIENLWFVRVNANAEVGKHPPTLIGTFQSEYMKSRRLTEKQMVASEIYASSFFDVSPRSRFITLVTAVEALLILQERSDEVQSLVGELEAAVRQSTLDGPTKESINGSLQWVKYQSIGQAGRELARQLVPNELFDGQLSADFFTRCYGLRSQILHRGTIEKESVDIYQLANIMETFVAKLLLASLNSGA
jgi:hypothetical protein